MNGPGRECDNAEIGDFSCEESHINDDEEFQIEFNDEAGPDYDTIKMLIMQLKLSHTKLKVEQKLQNNNLLFQIEQLKKKYITLKTELSNFKAERNVIKTDSCQQTERIHDNTASQGTQTIDEDNVARYKKTKLSPNRTQNTQNNNKTIVNNSVAPHIEMTPAVNTEKSFEPSLPVIVSVEGNVNTSGFLNVSTPNTPQRQFNKAPNNGLTATDQLKNAGHLILNNKPEKNTSDTQISERVLQNVSEIISQSLFKPDNSFVNKNTPSTSHVSSSNVACSELVATDSQCDVTDTEASDIDGDLVDSHLYPDILTFLQRSAGKRVKIMNYSRIKDTDWIVLNVETNIIILCVDFEDRKNIIVTKVTAMKKLDAYKRYYAVVYEVIEEQNNEYIPDTSTSSSVSPAEMESATERNSRIDPAIPDTSISSSIPRAIIEPTNLRRPPYVSARHRPNQVVNQNDGVQIYSNSYLLSDDYDADEGRSTVAQQSRSSSFCADGRPIVRPNSSHNVLSSSAIVNSSDTYIIRQLPKPMSSTINDHISDLRDVGPNHAHLNESVVDLNNTGFRPIRLVSSNSSQNRSENVAIDSSGNRNRGPMASNSMSDNSRATDQNQLKQSTGYTEVRPSSSNSSNGRFENVVLDANVNRNRGSMPSNSTSDNTSAIDPNQLRQSTSYRQTRPLPSNTSNNRSENIVIDSNGVNVNRNKGPMPSNSMNSAPKGNTSDSSAINQSQLTQSTVDRNNTGFKQIRPVSSNTAKLETILIDSNWNKNRRRSPQKRNNEKSLISVEDRNRKRTRRDSVRLTKHDKDKLSRPFRESRTHDTLRNLMMKSCSVSPIKTLNAFQKSPVKDSFIPTYFRTEKKQLKTMPNVTLREYVSMDVEEDDEEPSQVLSTTQNDDVIVIETDTTPIEV